MIRGKKALFGHVVDIVLIAASAIVLVLIAGTLINLLMQASTEGKCTASAQLSSSTRVAGVETISIDCPMKLVDITMDDLRAEITRSRNALDKILTSGKYTTIIKDFAYTKTEPISATKLNEFALDKTVAEEMRVCWQKLGEGKLELFNAWYNPIKVDDKSWLPWIKIETPPITCVICARIKFDSDIQKDYADVQSLNEWLKINTVPKREATYYDYLIDEVHDQFLFTPDWHFQTKEPIAVVFARMSANSKEGFFRNMLSNFGLTDLGKAQKGIDVLYLVEYSKVGEYCDYLANTPPEKV
jgi:hypothetical protein